MRHLNNSLSLSASIMAFLEFFIGFNTLNALELPLELLQAGVNGAKSMDYARRMAFPLVSDDNAVEMPPNVEENLNNFGSALLEDNDNMPADDDDDNVNVGDFGVKTEMPKWLQMQLQQAETTQQQQQQHNNFPHHNMLNTHKPSASSKHQHQHHTSDNQYVHSSAAASPLRRCSIEISSKIPGICQAMGSIGNACVSGDYIDVFNSACL